MHYAFDTWMARNFPGCPFERYADDAVVHCTSGGRPRMCLPGSPRGCSEVGLRLHPDKTRIVYCKDGRRRAEHEHTSFTFLGYAFRARGARSKNGRNFTGFLPAISPEALKAKGAELRAMRIHRRTDLSLDDLARWLNPIVAGWINYYGRFYRTALVSPPAARQRLPEALGREEVQAAADPQALQPVVDRAARKAARPVRPLARGPHVPTADQKSPVTGDCHAGICGSRGLRCPRPPDSCIRHGPTGRSLASRACCRSCGPARRRRPPRPSAACTTR